MFESLRHSLCIQNVVLNGIQDAEKLFLQVSEAEGTLKRYSSDTYINIFHYARWRDLTGCDEVYLHVLCGGKGRLFLYGVSQTVGEKQCKESNRPVQIAFCDVDTPERGGQEWKICLSADYDFFFLTWEYEKHNRLNIEKASYEVSYEFVKRDVNIAIVSTTCHRADDIAFLANAYVSACRHDAYFDAASHLFIINNEGYSSIQQTQRNFFDGHLTGADKYSGVSIPDFIEIGKAFGIKTVHIHHPKEVIPKIHETMTAKEPVICNVHVNPHYIFTPKLASRRQEDGTMFSSSLEDMYPFLDKQTIKECMIHE